MNVQKPFPLPHRTILGMRLDAASNADATRIILKSAKEKVRGYVCAANVHMVMESHDEEAFQRIVNGAVLVIPDGMPLVWGLRFLGVRKATHIRGYDLTVDLLEASAREGVTVGFYGGSIEVLNKLLQASQKRFSQLKAVYSYSPPFRQMSHEEDERIITEINDSGVNILFVGLGCPKQERWMAEHAGRIDAIMIGVGAAFDFLGGSKPQAPRWMMSAGLEWLFRLVIEPRRLWRRYCIYNARFIVLFIMQLLSNYYSIARQKIFKCMG